MYYDVKKTVTHNASKPLYDFYLDALGNLCMTTFTEYQEVIHHDFNGNEHLNYHIRTANGLRIKMPGQLDRFLNKHYISFSDDRSKVIEAIQAYFKTRTETLEADLERLRYEQKCFEKNLEESK